jgi:membrane-bound lytic murein transglycosylase B
MIFAGRRKHFARTLAAFALIACCAALPVAAQDYVWNPADVAARRSTFIDSMVARHGFDRAELVGILSGATIQQSALNSISRPAERVVPWFEYRQIFMNAERIEAGARFWAEH